MHELLFFSMRNQRDREIDEEASSQFAFALIQSAIS